MKIIVSTEHVGRFEWVPPESVEKCFQELGKILRGEMALTEEEAENAEHAFLAEIQNTISGFLSLIVGIQVGPGSLSIVGMEMLKGDIRERAGTMRELCEAYYEVHGGEKKGNGRWNLLNPVSRPARHPLLVFSSKI